MSFLKRLNEILLRELIRDVFAILVSRFPPPNRATTAIDQVARRARRASSATAADAVRRFASRDPWSDARRVSAATASHAAP